MYSPRLKEKQIRKLYQLREEFTRNGKKMTMTEMVQEAVDNYIESLEDDKKYAQEKLI